MGVGVCDKHKQGRRYFLTYDHDHDDQYDDDDDNVDDEDNDNDNDDDDEDGVLDRLAMGVCDKHKQGEATTSIRYSQPSKLLCASNCLVKISV